MAKQHSSLKTLVLGASPNPGRYSFLAVNQLKAMGHPVIPVGIRDGEIAGIPIQKGFPQSKGIDTVTLYLNPVRQKMYYDYILSLKPRRLIFNPGTENDELRELAVRNGIEPLEACTLVMLSAGQY